MPSAPTPRQSSFELLRIVSMMLVLIIHTGYFTFGQPRQHDLLGHPGPTTALVVTQSFAAVCVNVFVLLSGWFGIHPTRRRLGAFVFQVVVLCAPVYLYYIFHGWLAEGQPFPTAALAVMKGFSMWFVGSYLILYVLAPALNAFCQSASRMQLRNIVISLLFLVFCCWPRGTQFANGSSALFFIVLYLMARYIRLYISPLNKINMGGGLASTSFAAC